jgi:DNA-binding NtrC family response regulator
MPYDDQLRKFCRSLLMDNDFTVLEAHNGREALLTSVQQPVGIDLLITDPEMAGISGMELGWAFNELWTGVNVLYISGSPRETVGGQLPDCAFLPKPFAPDALVDATGGDTHFGCAAIEMTCLPSAVSRPIESFPRESEYLFVIAGVSD